MKIKRFTKKLLLPLLCAYLLGSCTNENNKSLKNTGKIITFKLDFSGYFIPCESNKKNNSEYIAYYNFVTYKKISVFDIGGKHLYDVSIEKLIKDEKEEFFLSSFPSIDTFVLMSKYTNQVYLLDENANIIVKKDYSRYLLDGFELFPKTYFKDGVIQTALNHYDPNFPNNPKVSDLAKCYKNDYYLPKWFADKNFLDSSDYSQISFVLDSLYTRFAEKDEIVTEGRHVLPIDSGVLFYSGYTDTIYTFNDDFKLSRMAKATSKYSSEIGAKKTTFFEHLQDVNLFNKRIRNSSFISGIYYDTYKKMYYCFVRQPMKGDLLPFSIIVYDTNFNKLDEILMDEAKYYPSAFIGEKGLYVLNKDNNPKHLYFTIFNYE